MLLFCHKISLAFLHIKLLHASIIEVLKKGHCGLEYAAVQSGDLGRHSA
jgi:hypothetical protein